MFRYFIFVFLLLPFSASGQCIPEDLFNGKATLLLPKPTGWGSKREATPELIEKAKSMAKLNALEKYVSKCIEDRTKMDRYLLAADKIKSKVDLIVNIERKKEKIKDKELIISIRASVNSKAFDSIVVGQIGAAKSTKKRKRMISIFIARKANATYTKNFDDKVTKITKNEAGSAAEKSASTDGTTTAVNKQASNYTKTQTGGSTSSKQVASERKWIIMPSSDLNSNIQKKLTDNGYRGGVYSSFVKNCSAPPSDIIEQEFAELDKLSDDTEAAIYDGMVANNRCEKRFGFVTIGTINVNTAMKINGVPSVLASMRIQIAQMDDGFPEIIASIGPIQIRGRGAEDNEAERNALTIAGEKAAQEIVDSLKAAGI
tara:strand:- start:304 stop:1422 length:1119 start_codon:yes stop_codon:yes gene_type:complete